VDHRESNARTARPDRRHVGCAKVENDADIGVGFQGSRGVEPPTSRPSNCVETV
jgi:hypothetical protein